MSTESLGLREAITEALALDVEGNTFDAVDKYIASLYAILGSLQPAVDNNLLVMARNCLDRVRQLSAAQKQPPAAQGPGFDYDHELEEIERLYQSSPPHQPQPVHPALSQLCQGKQHARSQSMDKQSRKGSLALSPTARLDSNLACLLRRHQDEQIAADVRQGSPCTQASPLQSIYSVQQQSVGQQLLKSLFIQTSDKVRELMLSARAQTRSRLSGEGVFEWVRSSFESFDLPVVPSEEEQAIRDELARLAESDDYAPLVTVIHDLFSRKKDHPVVQLTDDFIRRLRHLLLAPSTGPVSITDELLCYQQHFTDWFCHQFAADSEQALLAAELALQDYILGTSCLPLLLEMYSLSTRARDTELSRKLCLLGFEHTGDLLGIRPGIEKLLLASNVFPIHLESSVLQAAVQSFGKMQVARTPMAKLKVLARCLGGITSAFPSSVELGGEDLMRLLALLMVRQPLPMAYSAQAAFIADLVPERLLRGEAGYLLATLQSAIDFVEQVDLVPPE